MTAEEWYELHSEAARAEGWDIWDCTSTEGGHTWQVQVFDDAEAIGRPALNNDVAAWALVANGKEPHHYAARAFLRINCPAEFCAVMGELT
jgi:hypothetical protein